MTMAKRPLAARVVARATKTMTTREDYARALAALLWPGCACVVGQHGDSAHAVTVRLPRALAGVTS